MPTRRMRKAKQRKAKFLSQFDNTQGYPPIFRRSRFSRLIAECLRYGDPADTDLEVCGFRICSTYFLQKIWQDRKGAIAAAMQNIAEEMTVELRCTKLQRPRVISEFVKRYSQWSEMVERMTGSPPDRDIASSFWYKDELKQFRGPSLGSPVVVDFQVSFDGVNWVNEGIKPT